MANLVKSALSIFSGKIAITVIGFLFTPILVRLISQEQYGTYVTIIAVFTVISVISRGGIFDATRKIIAESHTRKQQSSVVSTAIILTLVYSCVTLFIISSIVQMGVVPGQYMPYIPTLAVGLVFTNIFSVVRGSFYGIHTEITTEILGVIQNGLYAVFAITFLILDGELLRVFLGYSGSYAIASVVGFYLLIKDFQLNIPRRNVFKSYGREIFGYGITQLVGGVSALLLYQADILLVEYFRASADTGTYKAALLPAEYIWLVPSVIQTVFLQRAADLWSQNNISAINEQLATGVKYAILSLSLFGIGLFPLSATFLETYFGNQYIQGYRVLQILLCGTMLFGISRVMIPIFQATGWVRYTEFLTFVTLCMNISLNLLLIPKYGIVGAGIGTTISYSFMLIWAIILWSQSCFKFPNYTLVIKWVFPQIVYGIIYIPIVYLIDLGNIASLIGFPIFGLLTFVLINSRLGTINLSDIQKLISSMI